MKAKLGIALSIAATLFMAHPAYAHVIIRDEANKVGAILHVTPDDDPIAGEPSDLFFSLQNQSLSGKDISMVIFDRTTQQSTTLDTDVTSSGISSVYTFPSRGTYAIMLQISGAGGAMFVQEQRVSRGIGTDAGSPADWPAIRALLILSLVALLVTGAIVYNRRKEIFTQSTF